MSAGLSPFRSYALGRSGPSILIHAVGGWLRYRCEARPSKASRPCSSSNVPSGSPTCACLVTLPLDSGNISAPFGLTGATSCRKRRRPLSPCASRGPSSCAPCREPSGSCCGLPYPSRLPFEGPTLVVFRFVADRQLGAPLAGRVDGVQEGRPHARL